MIEKMMLKRLDLDSISVEWCRGSQNVDMAYQIQIVKQIITFQYAMTRPPALLADDRNSHLHVRSNPMSSHAPVHG